VKATRNDIRFFRDVGPGRKERVMLSLFGYWGIRGSISRNEIPGEFKDKKIGSGFLFLLYLSILKGSSITAVERINKAINIVVVSLDLGKVNE
jgi:hypothetical protein